MKYDRQYYIEQLPDYLGNQLSEDETNTLLSVIATDPEVKNALDELQIVFDFFEKEHINNAIEQEAKSIHVNVLTALTKTKEIVLYPAYALSGLAACIMLWISVPRQNEENNIIAEVSQNHASIVSANDDLVDSDDLSFFTDHYDTLDEFVLSEALNLYAGDANPDNVFPSLHPEIENELFDFIVKESNEQEM